MTVPVTAPEAVRISPQELRENRRVIERENRKQRGRKRERERTGGRDLHLNRLN